MVSCLAVAIGNIRWRRWPKAPKSIKKADGEHRRSSFEKKKLNLQGEDHQNTK